MHELGKSQLLPREKLCTYGKESLTDAELLAIFLRTGVKGRNVLEVATDLIHNAGSLDALARMETEEIKEICKGIGDAKAATIAAVFELGGRAIREAIKRTPLTDPGEVYKYLASILRWNDQESIAILLLDVKKQPIKHIIISTGTLNETIVHPRDIFKPVIIHKAHSFILAHNHPSGNPEPSNADNNLTQKIAEAAHLLQIKFLDHIIIGKPLPDDDKPYYSYREEKSSIFNVGMPTVMTNFFENPH